MVFTFVAIYLKSSLLKQATTTNERKPQANEHKPPANKYKLSANDQKLPAKTTNNYSCRSNHKTDVSFLRPAPSNYKDHSNFEKHKQSMMGNCLLLSQYLCGANKIGFACFGKLRSQYSSCHQEKSTFLLIEFKQKRNCFLVF